MLYSNNLEVADVNFYFISQVLWFFSPTYRFKSTTDKEYFILRYFCLSPNISILYKPGRLRFFAELIFHVAQKLFREERREHILTGSWSLKLRKTFTEFQGIHFILLHP